MLDNLDALADFGTRSLVTHAIMAVALLGAVGSAYLVGDTVLSLVAFSAFAGFTSGMWVCQSIHALGDAQTDSDYTGVLDELGV